MNSTHRNVGLLAACQAMLFTNNSTLIAINGLAGLALAPHASLATLTVTCWVLGGALATMPASLHMKRVGRQAGLASGMSWGIVGALICGLAIYLQNFWLLCLGTLVWGVFNAYGQYYRFAAIDALADGGGTLVLAGEYDPITPPSNGQEVAQDLTHSNYFLFPGQGHGQEYSSDCSDQIISAFEDTPDQRPSGTCISQMTEPAFQTGAWNWGDLLVGFLAGFFLF